MQSKDAVQAEILVIDDSLPYVEALHRDALRHGMSVVHAGSLEEGREKYGQGENPALAGIVLDVKCLKEKKQQVPDSSFLAAAVHYFGKVASHLPMVILTGEPDQYRNLSELYAGTLRVYSKGRDEDAMLSYLAAEAAKLDYLKIAGSHPEAFAAVRLHLVASVDSSMVLACCTSRSLVAP